MPGKAGILGRMNTKRLVLTNTAAQLVGKVVTMGTTILVTAIITRDLGDGGYGQFTLIMGFASVFYIIADFGLNAVVTRELSGQADDKQAASYLSSLLALRVVLSLLLMGGAALSLLFLPYSSVVKWGILLSLLTILTQALYASLSTLFQVHLQYQRGTVASIIASIALLVWVGAVILFVPDGRLLYYVGGYVLHGVVMILTASLLIRRFISRFSFTPDWSLARTLLHMALPIGLMLAFGQIHARADIFLISLVELPETVALTRDGTLGIYGLAYRVFEVVLIVATFFMNAAYPVFVRHGNESSARLNQSFRLVVAFLFGMSLLGLTVLYPLAPWVVRVLAGEGFEHAAVALRLLSIGLPAFFVSQALQWYIITIKRQRVLPFIYLTGAIVTVLLNLWLIPLYSYAAAAVVTWVVEYLILVLMVGYCGWYWRQEA